MLEQFSVVQGVLSNPWTQCVLSAIAEALGQLFKIILWSWVSGPVYRSCLNLCLPSWQNPHKSELLTVRLRLVKALSLEGQSRFARISLYLPLLHFSPNLIYLNCPYLMHINIEGWFEDAFIWDEYEMLFDALQGFQKTRWYIPI